MKRKDIGLLVVSAGIFAVAGIVGFKQLAPKQAQNKEISVEVITPIVAEFDQNALKIIADPAKVRNFTPAVDLTNGLGNAKPFNPL